MSMDYFSISVVDTSSSASSEYLPLNTPENKRELPCDTCSLAQECEDQILECMAARRWYASGDFLDNQVGRLRRKIKSFG